ncbi:Piso0_000874 [Millerozyma farinosa CBS 7064]|uniref:Ubiquitin carboxyl-terminal hydrolase n=1 Tax=Pichia sorbitophila (strain ATCC MYA-4447 / BCRC 22081 / CBS 7064 / NBRC 10061 / NRRL Y-12695) TaxID=559304 RepID=G8YRR9_PICSO|nr:Piso0_000874 [Millerozyma farinosa CBS 7064]
MTVCQHIPELETSLRSDISPGTRVYKDDCMYCFDTAANNDTGLDICLTCLQSFSRGALNHTLKHQKDVEHYGFYNVKKTLKTRPQHSPRSSSESGDDHPSPKYAKLEVKETKEEDLYDISESIYCGKCELTINISECPTKLQALVENIKSANSSSKSDEIKAWEQEITPCEHSVDIQQQENPELSLSQCSLCDLKENLWICLTCGTTGCGRKQFGSTLNGNSHALKHYENTGHSVAIKLGSLSANQEDSYDCYCYKCNDEVKVVDLQEKLIKYGIDISKAVKTEKNLIELNLDQNLNWQFNLEDSSGEKLKPIYGRGFTGLKNLGNTCYLNSVVQALYSLKAYQAYFKDKDFPEYSVVKDPSNDIFSQLLKMSDGLNSGRYSKPGNLKGEDYQDGINPSSFKYLIGQGHVEFQTQKQQDAFEFLLYLLDKIDKELGATLNEQLKFLLSDQIVCTSCQKGKITHNLVDNLSLQLESEVIGVDSEQKKIYKETNLLKSFATYCSPEEISGYQCDNCNAHTTAIKTQSFRSFPDVLIVNANRIQLENWVPVKTDVPVSIPETIDISNYATMLHLPEGIVEQGVDEEEKKEEFVPNTECLVMLTSMGFPESRCAKALYSTGNSNAEDAVNWLFAHNDDPDIDDPIDASGSSSATDEPPADLVENVVAMGFSSPLAKKALILNSLDISAAVEWLFANPDDDGVLHNDKPTTSSIENQLRDIKTSLLQKEDTEGQYTLKAVVCHKGTSTHTGHYVVFIRKIVDGQPRWTLFNDEKIVLCADTSLDDIVKNGYIYVFEKNDSGEMN